jgi:hypothetical protein
VSHLLLNDVRDLIRDVLDRSIAILVSWGSTARRVVAVPAVEEYRWGGGHWIFGIFEIFRSTGGGWFVSIYRMRFGFGGLLGGRF